MSGLHVDASNMNTQGINTVNNSESLGDEIGALKTNVENLMTIWRGPAASEFNGVVDEQIANLQEFRDLLNTLGEKISEGARHFNDVEEENASMASHLF